MSLDAASAVISGGFKGMHARRQNAEKMVEEQCKLVDLKVAGWALSPDFASAQEFYTLTVSSNTTRVRIQAVQHYAQSACYVGALDNPEGGEPHLGTKSN